jgi:hypothetical protein
LHLLRSEDLSKGKQWCEERMGICQSLDDARVQLVVQHGLVLVAHELARCER